jgi:FkbM family methyltransferase
MDRKEFVSFTKKHFNDDTRAAFLCRMARFGAIGLYLPLWNHKVKSMCGHSTQVKDVVYSKMNLKAEDKGVSRDLMVNGIREPYATLIMQQILMPNDVALDIGANIGYYALQEARICDTVYAIEPVKESAVSLIENIKMNNYHNIEVFHMACGDKDGEGEINVSEKRNWSSMRPENSRGYIRSDKIPIITVDTFIKGKKTPTLIRMDVEGYEYEIINGMSGLFKSGVPLKIFVEMHFDIMREKAVRLCQILRMAGFKVVIATIEPHPAIMNANYGNKIVKLLERGIGATTGFNQVSIDDFINDRRYSSGQIEYMEVLFERT